MCKDRVPGHIGRSAYVTPLGTTFTASQNRRETTQLTASPCLIDPCVQRVQEVQQIFVIERRLGCGTVVLMFGMLDSCKGVYGVEMQG